MRARPLIPALAALLASSSTGLAATTAPSASSAAPAPAAAAAATGVVIERVVAVVGREVILLTELRDRARPYFTRIAQSVAADKRAEAEREVVRALLEQMIEEQLTRAEADRLRVGVATSEIDAAVAALAQGQGVTPPQLYEAARKQGMSKEEYREELRRQLLDGKLGQQILRPRIKDYAALSDADRAAKMGEARGAWLRELRAKTYVEVRP